LSPFKIINPEIIICPDKRPALNRQSRSFATMDVFMLPVEVDGQELELETRLVRQGYVYKFLVTINDNEFAFERDEEGELRAILDTDTYTTLSKTEQHLLNEAGKNLGKLID